MKKLRTLDCRPVTAGRLLLTCAIVLVSSQLLGQSICFNSHNDFAFGGASNAQCIDFGDFDNDGIKDLVEGSFVTGPSLKMAFIKGNANGTFQTPVFFEVGDRPLDVKAFDFNQDGNLDIVVANQTTASISLVLGNGDGTFGAPVAYVTGTTPTDITLGDFNEDGFMDLAVSCLAANVNIFLMDAGLPGTLISSGTVATGSGPRGIVTKDFNNDGHLDLATSNNSAGGFGVVYGTGTGTFGTATAYPTQTGAYHIISGDFNGDNLPDIAVSNETSNSVSVSINTGSGFLASTPYPVKAKPNGIKVGDFNGDNILDIATVEYEDNVFTTLQGTGTGTFLPAQHLICIGAPRDLVIYDCNNDGFKDAVVSTNVGQVTVLFLGEGDGTFQHRTSYPVGTNPQGIGKADFNNDGFQDIVVANTNDNNVQLLLNNGIGEFTNGGIFATDLGPMSVDAKDVNGDGNMDVITANNTNNTITVLLGNGAGSLASAGNFNCNAQPKIVKIGDVNNDGFQDAVVLNATNNFNVLLGSGSGTFGAPTSYPGANNGTDLELGLLNADAFLDVIMTAGGNNKLVISLNTGSGTFNPITEVNAGTNPKGLALGDVNNDGKLDAVIANYGSNNFQRFTGNGTGGFSPITATFTGTDTGPMDVELADLNNDGNLDVIGICEVSSASTGYAPVFTGNGSGAFTFYKRFSTDMSPHRLVVADWNNDGMKDAAVVNRLSKTVSILKNTTAFITANGPLTFCEGAGTTLSVTPATTYLWSDGQTIPIIAPVTSGTYTAQTWTGHSSWCTSTSNAITVNVSPSPTLVLSSDVSICSGQSTTLTVSGADSYLWAGGLGTLSSVTVSPTTTQYYVVEGFGLNGCARKDSIQVTVVGAPNATFTTLNANYCQDAAAVTLVPGTPGGVFSGGGVSGSTFNPSTASLGSNTITYFVDLGGGCSNTSSQTVTVSATPIATFSGLGTNYCASAMDATLSPAQGGGTFSGTGVSGNQFSPTTAGVGTFLITYSITTGGCTNSSAVSTTVNPIPNAAFSGLVANYCSTEGAVTLTPSIAGGTFSGTGVVGSTFNPASATLGANTVTYTITNGFGCTNQTSFVVNVSTQPDANFSGLAASYCESVVAPVTLTPIVGGGTFSGPGISGANFTPSNANLGTNTITYTVSLGSCSSTSTLQTIVYALPNTNFSGLNGTYCANDAASTLVPGTSGGIFSGTGVTGNTFDPSLASLGANTVTYALTDGNGCSNSSALITNVVSGPSPNFTGLAVDYCVNDASVTLTPTSGGGTFSGPGITGASFNPSTANLGLNTITYQVSGSGCTNTFSLQTTIHTIPTATFTGLDATYCSADAISTLVPTQAGGTFTGSGVVGSTFNPATASIGSNVITYSISDGFGCSNLSTISTVVTESFDATFTGLAVDYCQSQTAPVNLVPVTSGGTFTGSGISGTQFTPSTATLGLNTINYEVVNGGCISNYTVQTTVHVTPTATFTGLDATYCSADAISTLVPTQAGGTFTGSGVVGSTFNPATATIGSNVITYSISDGFGCSNLSTISTVVTESFDATFTGLAVDYCQSQTAPVNLVPVTSGGTFTGSGISGTQFTPSTATLGLNTINYEVVNGACISNYAVQTTVHVTPTATFTGLDATYCSADAISTLVPTQAGGTFTGSGVVGSTFNPATATIGSNVITYSISDGFGCSNLSTISTVVTESFDATFTGLAVDYCQSQTAPVNLVPVTSGGTFTGSGISGTQFTPSTATLGLNTINYEVVNGACISNYAVQTTVHVTPTATFTGLDATYCSADAISTLVPTQAGGTFTGSGVVGSTFNPATATIGSNVITYSISDGFGCSNLSTISTVVTESFDATFTGLAVDYCQSQTAPVNLVPVTSGGTFTGSGISGTQFTPSTATLGLNTINYEVVNGACISNYAVQTTVHVTPTATFTGLDATYCSADAISTLVPTQAGGTFTGSGVVGSTFNPATASIGSNVITYSISDGFGCSNLSTISTVVTESFDATFTGLAVDYCQSQTAPVNLVPVTSGGTFTGSGISGTQFTPSTATLGLNTINYEVVNGACISNYAVQTTVHVTPTATFTGLDATYCSADAISTLVPTQAGGTFTGSGVVGSTFNPATASIGSNVITYSISDGFGCSNLSTISTVVTESFDATFTGLAVDYCQSQTAPVNLVPVTSGGTFTGSGISGTQFTPSTATLGLNTINYEVVNGACISNYAVQTTVHVTPTATFTGLDATYCSADAISTLVPTQAGGTFTGSGVVGSTFNPATASIGSNVITYSISDGFGCSNLSTISTVVTESFDATFTGLAVDYCQSQTAPVNLVPVTSGGTFTGSGISGTQFTPSTATLGLNTINYEVVNGGCISNYVVQTTVHVTPTATFTGLDATYCSADATDALVPTVLGGSFSGGGIVGFNFQPNTAVIGTNFIAYTLIDGFGCTGTSTQSTIVTESLDPSFSGLLTEYCSNETSPIILVPVTSGGTFTGNGISGMQFTPSNASLGANTINYQLVNAGCISNASFVTTINSVPDASFTGLTTNYCNANQDFTLTPLVSGGIFSGPGMTGNIFNPYFAGTGNFVITYTVDDVSGCSGVSSQNISVYTSPNASFNGLDAHYCIYDVPATLIPAETGGVFSGPGVVGNQFSPGTASIGLFNVTYDISNANCTSTYTFATTVHDVPSVTYTGLGASYCSGDVGSTLVPTPLGGIFTGAGMIGNQFSPAGLTGNYTIEYEYTDAFGCSAIASHSTEVIATEDPFFTGVDALHCSSDGLVTLVPTTAGGVFSGNGVVGSTFNPGLAPIGVNNIQYQIGSGSCIGTYQFSTIILAAPNVAVSTNSNSLSVSLEFGTSYQWINCADMQPIIGATNFNFVPPFEGSFAVIASNANCTDTSLCSNFFLDLKDLSSIVMSYYPNPSSGNLTIELEETAELEIIDMSGRVIAREHLMNGKNILELSHVSRGMYQLYLTTEKGLRGSYPFVKN